LHSGGISPRNVESAATVVADFAYAGLAVRNGTAMAAGKAAHAIVVELLVEYGIGFADFAIENVAEGGHGKLLLVFYAVENIKRAPALGPITSPTT
jgi:hypothetical protein